MQIFRRSNKAASADSTQGSKSSTLSRKGSAQMSDDFAELGGDRQDSDMGKVPSAGPRIEGTRKMPSTLESTNSFR